MPTALVVGHDSELGRIASVHLKKLGWKVIGTSRRNESLSFKDVYYADFNNQESISNACIQISEDISEINLVIMSVGHLSPVGPISQVNFAEWAASINSNFINQVYCIREVLKAFSDNEHAGIKFLTFAGSGTNSAPLNYSAYTLSKIALIKSMELLAAEHPDHFFISLGTGWMKSAIHDQTLKAGLLAGTAYSETVRRMKENDFGSPELLCEFLDWYVGVTDLKVSGRNIALQGDDWNQINFLKEITSSNDSFKLRRVRG